MKVSKRKEIIKMKVESNKIENKKSTKKKTIKQKAGSLQRSIKLISFTRLMGGETETQITSVRQKAGSVTADSTTTKIVREYYEHIETTDFFTKVQRQWECLVKQLILCPVTQRNDHTDSQGNT